jgi:hypothetical protein
MDKNTGTLVAHRSIRSVLPQLLFGLAVVGIFYWYIEHPHYSGLKVVIGGYETHLPIWPLLLAVLLVRPLLMILDCRHQISQHHIRSESGRCSFKREAIEVPFESLKGVKVDQTVWERLLGVGTVVAWTGIPGSPDVKMHGIGSPHRLAKFLAAKIDQLKMKQHA